MPGILNPNNPLQKRRLVFPFFGCQGYESIGPRGRARLERVKGNIANDQTVALVREEGEIPEERRHHQPRVDAPAPEDPGGCGGDEAICRISKTDRGQSTEGQGRANVGSGGVQAGSVGESEGGYIRPKGVRPRDVG